MQPQILEQLINTTPLDERARPSPKVDAHVARYIASYERLRNIVGFHEEHLWRRFAIRRIIKRKLFVSTRERPRAEELVSELILAQYVKEEDINEAALNKIDQIIDKYVAAADLFSSDQLVRRTSQDWFFGIMATEIEDALGLLAHQEALLLASLDEMRTRYEFPRHYITADQQAIFLLITACRVVLKADPEFIAYEMIKRWFPKWFDGQEAVAVLLDDVYGLKDQIRQYEQHLLYKQLLRATKPWAVLLWVFEEVIKKYRGNFSELPLKTYTVIREINLRLQRKVKRQVWRSFVYLLITKFTLIVTLELPYDWWRTGMIHHTQPIMTVGIPLLLLLILTIGIEAGSAGNTKFLISEVEKLAFGQASELDPKIKIPDERSLARAFLFYLIFGVAYVLTYGAIIFGLWHWHFNLVAGFLFIFFVTMVSYMAVRIRYTAERFRLLERHHRFGRGIITFLALPLLRTGQWMVDRFTQYNFILLMFDLLFEAPYKTLVFVFRDFTEFAREMRETIR